MRDKKSKYLIIILSIFIVISIVAGIIDHHIAVKIKEYNSEYDNLITKKEAFIDIFKTTELDIYSPKELAEYKRTLNNTSNCIRGESDLSCYSTTLEYNPYILGYIPKEFIQSLMQECNLGKFRMIKFEDDVYDCLDVAIHLIDERKEYDIAIEFYRNLCIKDSVVEKDEQCSTLLSSIKSYTKKYDVRKDNP